MPMLKAEKFGTGDVSWLGSAHAIGNARTETLDPSKFTTQTKNGVIPSGTPLALKDGLLTPYNSGGSGEETKLIGFLLYDQPANVGKLGVAVLDHGRVKTNRLPGTFTAPDKANDLTTIVYITEERG